MKIRLNEPPREFRVGLSQQITISDCGRVYLEDDEQVTFVHKEASGEAEYDVAKKSWGFYATPSLNSRLQRFGYKSALVENQTGQWYLMLVHIDKMNEFEEYAKVEKQTILGWLDEQDVRLKIKEALTIKRAE